MSVSLSTPNDPNPTVWVNHAITVDATPSTGPSGLGGMSCGVDMAPQRRPIRPAGLTVNGDGVKTVSCTAWNNAVDPQGNHNSGTSSVTVHIDEAPPALSLEPVNPNDPTGVVADTSDGESGVAGGSIEMAPAGTRQLDGAADDVHRHPAGSAFRRRRAARRIRLQGPIVRQRRQLRRQPAGRSRCRRGLRPSPRLASSRFSATRCPSHAGEANAAEQATARPSRRAMSAAGRAGRLVSDSASDVEVFSTSRPLGRGALAAAGTLAAGSSGSVTRSLAHPRPHPRRRTGNGCSVTVSCDGAAARSTARLATRANVAFGRPVRRARAADEQRRPAACWPAGRGLDGSGQRLERLHAGRGGRPPARTAAGPRLCRQGPPGSSKPPTRARRPSCPPPGPRP